MPKNTNAPSSPSFKKTRMLLESSWNNIADLKLIDGVKDLAAVGGNAIAASTLGVISFIKNTTDMNNLSAAQKILPYTLIAVSVPVTVAAMVVTVAGLSTIAPPFMFAASIAALVRSTGTLIADKKSLDNLNRQLITQDKLFEKIDKSKKMTEEQKQVVKDYVDLPEKIYFHLYALRQHIVENQHLTTEQKNNLIKSVNSQIENFHKGDISKIDFSGINAELKLSEKAAYEINGRIIGINAYLERYQNAKNDYQALPLPSDLKSKVKHFKETHEHIYAQDLTPKTKQKMLELLNKPSIKRSDLKAIYAQMANHFVNTHSENQRVALDKSLVAHIRESNPTIDARQAQALELHLALPREIYHEVKKIHDNLPPEKQEAFRRTVTDNIKKHSGNLMDLVPTSINSFLQDNQIESTPFNDNLKKINLLKEKSAQLVLSVEGQSPAQQGGLLAQHRISKVELPEKTIALLNQHRNAALIDYIQTGGINVDPPNVSNAKFMQPSTVKDTKVGKYMDEKVGKHIAEKADHIKAKVTKPFEKAAVKAKKKLLEKYYGKEKAAEIMAAKKSKSKARAEFHDQFGDTHTFLKKAEERNFLKKAIPRDILNVVLSAVNVVVTGVSTIAIPAIFSPGAPAAAGVAVGLGVVSTGLTAAAVLNTAELLVEHQRSMDKTSNANEKAVGVATPNVGKDAKMADQLLEHHERKVQKQQDKQERKQEREARKQEKKEQREERKLEDAQNPKEKKHRVLVFHEIHKRVVGEAVPQQPKASSEARHKTKPG